MELNRKLILEKRVRVADGAGGFADAWSVLGSIWAAIIPTSGREAAGGGGEISVVRAKVILRSARVGSSMRPHAGQRFVEGARSYLIESVADYKGQAQFLECRVREEGLS